MEELHEAARDGRISDETVLRPERGGTDFAYGHVHDDAEPEAPADPPRRRRRRRPTAERTPVEHEPEVVVVQQHPGSLVQGVVMGFMCGCIALAFLVGKPGPETRRGIYWGLGLNLLLSLLALTTSR
jgi:hypothetical protein